MKHDMVIGHYSSSGYVGTKAEFLKDPTIKFEYDKEALDALKEPKQKSFREEYEYKPPENDPVNRPSHYQYSSLQPVEVIRAWDLNFALGNVIKYICRSKRKNGLIDLEKALWYLKDEIEAQKTAKENEEEEEK